MSSVETRKFEPATGTAVNLGASGDAVTLPAGVTLQTNTLQDAGGNTIFTSDGAGTLSSVNSGLQVGMVFISSQTASSSSSLSFTSGIDSTYDEYMFVILNINPDSHAYHFAFQVSIDGGSNYNVACTSTSFQAAHKENGTGAALGYNTGNDQAQGTAYQPLGWNMHNDADASATGILHLFAPSSTTYVKHFYSRVSAYQNDSPGTHDGGAQDCYAAGYFDTTSAVNAIAFQMNNGNFDGTIYLYGIK